MTLYSVTMVNGWGVYTNDSEVLDAFCEGAPVITIPTLLINGGDGSVYHVSRESIICIREVRRCPASTRA